VPNSVAFRDAFPLSGAGKVLKRELRKDYENAGAPIVLESLKSIR